MTLVKLKTNLRLVRATTEVEIAEDLCKRRAHGHAMDWAKLAIESLKGIRSRTATQLRNRAWAVIETIGEQMKEAT